MVVGNRVTIVAGNLSIRLFGFGGAKPGKVDRKQKLTGYLKKAQN